jgi:hypothetical protein
VSRIALTRLRQRHDILHFSVYIDDWCIVTQEADGAVAEAAGEVIAEFGGQINETKTQKSATRFRFLGVVYDTAGTDGVTVTLPPDRFERIGNAVRALHDMLGAGRRTVSPRVLRALLGWQSWAVQTWPALRGHWGGLYAALREPRRSGVWFDNDAVRHGLAALRDITAVTPPPLLAQRPAAELRITSDAGDTGCAGVVVLGGRRRVVAGIFPPSVAAASSAEREVAALVAIAQHVRGDTAGPVTVRWASDSAAAVFAVSKAHAAAPVMAAAIRWWGAAHSDRGWVLIPSWLPRDALADVDFLAALATNPACLPCEAEPILQSGWEWCSA